MIIGKELSPNPGKLKSTVSIEDMYGLYALAQREGREICIEVDGDKRLAGSDDIGFKYH